MENGQGRVPSEYFSESAVATFIVTPNHEVIFWNKACEELTGIAAAKVMFTKEHWRAFYESERPCLVDIVIDGNYDRLTALYKKYGNSKLTKEGLYGEGWYDLGGARRYVIFDATPIFNDAGELVAAIETIQDITDIKQIEREKEEIIESLRANIAKSTSLKGFVPICSACKNIRNKDGEWTSLEKFFYEKAEILFSHGICPPCAKRLYPEFYDKMQGKK